MGCGMVGVGVFGVDGLWTIGWFIVFIIIVVITINTVKVVHSLVVWLTYSWSNIHKHFKVKIANCQKLLSRNSQKCF